MSTKRYSGTWLPVYMQYYYLALNNHHPKFQDVRVRRALAHCLDLDLGIQSILSDWASGSSVRSIPQQALLQQIYPAGTL